MRYLSPFAVAVLAVGLVAVPARADKAAPAKTPGKLRVIDEAKVFTAGGVTAAEGVLAATAFDHGLQVTVDTYDHPPADRKDAAEAAKKDNGKWRAFMKEWVKTRAQADKAGGIYVVVCHHPGGVAVIADRQTRERGFTDADEEKMEGILVDAFRTAKDKPDALTIQDGGLKSAIEFVVADLKDTTVVDPAGAKTAPAAKTGMGIGGWVCIGLCALAGVWLVIGLVRAFSGGGGGAGGSGGGGGGFMTGMLGGLFGAMAGMWLYNNVFGGHDMFGGSSDAFAGDGGGTTGDTGAGDYSNETGAGGGFDDGGGSGGGDWGGGGDFGGGDAGGGGDF